MGATSEEIVHSALLALTTTGFPSMMAAMELVNSVIEEKSS